MIKSVEEAWTEWEHEEYISGLPKGEQEIAKIAFYAAFGKGARSEAEIWAQWILADPGVCKYWEGKGGGEFSADDAASMMAELVEIVNLI